MTGLDFSPAAIREANQFAHQLGIDDATFMVFRLDDARETLGDQKFDVVYTGRGALCWLRDLTRWASLCASLLKTGGVLYLEEVHQVRSMLEVVEQSGHKTLQPQYNPFSRDVVSDTASGSYADHDADTGTFAYHCWEYTFSDIINPLISEGL